MARNRNKRFGRLPTKQQTQGSFFHRTVLPAMEKHKLAVATTIASGAGGAIGGALGAYLRPTPRKLTGSRKAIEERATRFVKQQVVGKEFRVIESLPKSAFNEVRVAFKNRNEKMGNVIINYSRGENGVMRFEIFFPKQTIQNPELLKDIANVCEMHRQRLQALDDRVTTKVASFIAQNRIESIEDVIAFMQVHPQPRLTEIAANAAILGTAALPIGFLVGVLLNRMIRRSPKGLTQKVLPGEKPKRQETAKPTQATGTLVQAPIIPKPTTKVPILAEARAEAPVVSVPERLFVRRINALASEMRIGISNVDSAEVYRRCAERHIASTNFPAIKEVIAEVTGKPRRAVVRKVPRAARIAKPALSIPERIDKMLEIGFAALSSPKEFEELRTAVRYGNIPTSLRIRGTMVLVCHVLSRFGKSGKVSRTALLKLAVGKQNNATGFLDDAINELIRREMIVRVTHYGKRSFFRLANNRLIERFDMRRLTNRINKNH